MQSWALPGDAAYEPSADAPVAQLASPATLPGLTHLCEQSHNIFHAYLTSTMLLSVSLAHNQMIADTVSSQPSTFSTECSIGLHPLLAVVTLLYGHLHRPCQTRSCACLHVSLQCAISAEAKLQGRLIEAGQTRRAPGKKLVVALPVDQGLALHCQGDAAGQAEVQLHRGHQVGVPP